MHKLMLKRLFIVMFWTTLTRVSGRFTSRWKSSSRGADGSIPAVSQIRPLQANSRAARWERSRLPLLLQSPETGAAQKRGSENWTDSEVIRNRFLWDRNVWNKFEFSVRGGVSEYFPVSTGMTTGVATCEWTRSGRSWSRERRMWSGFVWKLVSSLFRIWSLGGTVMRWRRSGFVVLFLSAAYMLKTVQVYGIKSEITWCKKWLWFDWWS